MCLSFSSYPLLDLLPDPLQTYPGNTQWPYTTPLQLIEQTEPPLTPTRMLLCTSVIMTLKYFISVQSVISNELLKASSAIQNTKE